ncbi:hypothetical protein LOK49_LG01G03433 [Camellia lanceoleosa]|uniref:Uncharacterized protein n=1 Tax=Camellia lanceoleosa TaxID=1840588 RepID=A0ACC0J0Q2_9ERIC|nr:hypothetical protein LOK49_LG01G03433 [Camellia lanceoleosa]
MGIRPTCPDPLTFQIPQIGNTIEFGGRRTNSPWTRSCERKRQDAASKTMANELVYWLCEHSTIISPKSTVAFPRFLKWDVATLVSAARGVNLSGHVDFQVNAGRLMKKDYEVKLFEVDGVNCGRSVGNAIEEFGGSVHEDDFVDMRVDSNVEGVDRGIYGRNVERGSTSVRFQTPTRDVPRNAGKHVMDVGIHVCYATKKIVELEMQINAKDNVISELRAEVDKLRQANKVQTLHLVGGFGSLMQAKDDEVKKLNTQNAELQRAINVLEDQLAEREVHNVTQAFRHVDVNVEGVNDGLSGNKHVADLANNATPNRVFAVTGDAVPVWDVTPVREQTNSVSEMQRGVMLGTEVVVISPNMAEGGRLNVRSSSFMWDVKRKDRKGFTLTGVGCVGVSGQTSKSTVVHLPSSMSNVVCNAENTGCTDVIDVDDVDVQSKRSRFDINNRHAVWKMMTVAEKKKITDAYNMDGDSVVMWDGQGHGVAVYFTDMKSLVRQAEIRGNVIDAYAVLLNAEQERINEGVDAADKSYFFSSICLDMMKNNNVRSRNRYVLDNLRAAKLFRYIHFPLCKDSHWTLVVYDTEDGSWKHFNSMRPRTGILDVHYMEALSLKNIVSEVQRQTIGNESIDTQDYDPLLESVADCPQQRLESLDCAIIVCAVMRQYVHHVEVRRSLHRGNCSVLRAIMLKSFVNDPLRGLKNDVD